MIVFDTGDFSAAEATADHGFNALGTHFHGSVHRLFQSPAKGDALLKLPGNIFSHELSFGIDRFNFIDIDEKAAAEFGIQLFLEVFDAGALAAYDDARLTGCNCHQDLVIAFALNFDAGNTGFETFGFDKVTNFFILDEVFAKIFLSAYQRVSQSLITPTRSP